MQTLVFEIANTFLDDAVALIRGCSRIIVQTLMAPIERLANACDVAGLLAERKARRRSPTNLNGAPRSHDRQARQGSCLFSLRFLGDLT